MYGAPKYSYNFANSPWNTIKCLENLAFLLFIVKLLLFIVKREHSDSLLTGRQGVIKMHSGYTGGQAMGICIRLYRLVPSTLTHQSTFGYSNGILPIFHGYG